MASLPFHPHMEKKCNTNGKIRNILRTLRKRGQQLTSIKSSMTSKEINSTCQSQAPRKKGKSFSFFAQTIEAVKY